MKVESSPNILSVTDSLFSIRAALNAAVKELKGLGDLDENLRAVAGAAPCALKPRVPKAVVAPELTDSGFAEALAKALAKEDPLTRAFGMSLVVGALARGLDDLERKRIKVESRLSRDENGTTEGEREAARRLSVSFRESRAAVERKLAYALKAWATARKKALAAIVETDGKMLSAFPDGSAFVRTAVLAASAANEISAIAVAEETMKRGEFRANRKGVKI